MMVNTTPSYTVSRDILLLNLTTDLMMNPESEPPRTKTSSVQGRKSSARDVQREISEISREYEDLISSKEECTGKLVSDIKKIGEHHPPHPQRWLVLAIYCCVSFMQVVVWNTWSPIAAAALYAFPSWTSGTVALFSNWGCLSFVLFIVPTCWLLNEKGLKFGCIIGSMLCTIGSGIRCITMDEYYFTICAHIGAFMNAIAGVIFGPSVVLLSSTWFPPDQRASATGAGTAVSALGMAASYLLGPLVITLPVPDFPDETECYRIRQEILKLLFLDFMAHFFLVWVVIFMFPSTPPTPPSRSSSISLGYKRNFGKSLKKLVRNKNIWLLGLSAALCSGMTGPWLSQLTILFSHKYLTAVETAKLGFWTIISSCLFSLTATRFSDLFQGHIKAIITGLLTYATAMFIWIFSIINISTTFHKHHLIFAVIGGFSASWGASPLFYELGAEIGYPVPEGLVAGYIMSMSSLSCVIVYGMFYVFSDTGMLAVTFILAIYLPATNLFS